MDWRNYSHYLFVYYCILILGLLMWYVLDWIVRMTYVLIWVVVKIKIWSSDSIKGVYIQKQV